MQLKIYYLDDEPDLRLLFSELFANPLRSIEVFAEASELYQAVKTAKPDVVFIDYRLPATTGIEIAQGLPVEVPKYLVTGELNVQPGPRFAGVITKPFDIPQIEEMLVQIALGKQAA